MLALGGDQVTVVSANTRSTTIRLSRTEAFDLTRSLCVAVSMLTRAEACNLDDEEVKIGKAYLPQFKSLLNRLTRLEAENGWFDEDK
jgi:hypothetical protein